MPETSRTLHEIASQIRSKNAGPFWMTMDIFFASDESYRFVLESGGLTEASIAALYRVNPEHVRLFELPNIHALKISFPRATIAGSFADGDLHAGQQHVPLSQIPILDDLFVYEGGVTVHPQSFRSVLGRQQHVLEYQVHQTERGAAIAFRSDGEVHQAEIHDAIERELAGLGLSSPGVTVEQVDGFARQATGKLKRFFPLSPGT